jgi:hypothetical protein
MISVYLQGGLGNQLFQIFTTIAYSLKHKVPFKLPSNKNDLVSPYGEIYKRPLYFENLLKKLQPFLTNNFHRQALYRERGHFYTEIPYCNQNLLLYGYFQSYKYFDKYKVDILKLIGFNKEKLNKGYNNTIAIHFRIGDYVHNTSVHPILSIEYYKKALNHILSKSNEKFTVIYYFEKKDTDQVTTNIRLLKEEFPNLIFKECHENLQDWEEMISMSCCTHNIIANSTFSWWGAYLNENSNKIVCYPSIWFGESLKNTCDLFLDDWYKIII